MAPALRLDGLPHGPDDWMFCNRRGRFLNPESLSQLFDRVVKRADVPRIRFHDLRYTHASLLVAHGVPIKVVTERLGHSHPGFTMHTYQHLLPGMSAAAAEQFAILVTTASRWTSTGSSSLLGPVSGQHHDRAGRQRRVTTLNTRRRPRHPDLGLHMVAGAGFEPTTFGL